MARKAGPSAAAPKLTAGCALPPFLPAGAVPWLAQLLLFGGPGAKEAAAACLAELAAVGPAVQQQIRDAGAVQLLQSLQTSGEGGWVGGCGRSAAVDGRWVALMQRPTSAPPHPSSCPVHPCARSLALHSLDWHDIKALPLGPSSHPCSCARGVTGLY